MTDPTWTALVSMFLTLNPQALRLPGLDRAVADAECLRDVNLRVRVRAGLPTGRAKLPQARALALRELCGLDLQASQPVQRPGHPVLQHAG